MDEAHVQHTVGLVQDEHLDGAQVDQVLGHQVKQAAGRGHQDVDAVFKRLDLRVLRNAAKDVCRAHAGVFPVRDETFVDLQGQFTRGGQDQHADRPPAALAGRKGQPVVAEVLQDGQRKRGRLAGAGLGRAKHVAAGEHQRDGLLLDRGRNRVALFADRLEEGRVEVQFFEIHWCLICS